jgi:branched-chain amino acid transport system substrate-binding protein
VSNVVPNYKSDQSALVLQYNKLIQQTAGAVQDFTSLEGYISGRVFIGGLLNHTGPFTPDGLVASFDTLPDLNLGIGANDGFSGSNHQYSGSVWGTSLQADGSFTNVYFFTAGGTIQFF